MSKKQKGGSTALINDFSFLFAPACRCQKTAPFRKENKDMRNLFIFQKNYIDKMRFVMYYKRVGDESQHRSQMEKSRSWPSAHDWKSCIPQKGIEGSNPSFSAKRYLPVFFGISGDFFVSIEIRVILVPLFRDFKERGICY